MSGKELHRGMGEVEKGKRSEENAAAAEEAIKCHKVT